MQIITMERALAYVEQVKQKFGKNSETFGKLKELMRRYRNRWIAYSMVSSEVELLFEGDIELIRGFNEFLPEDCKIPENHIIIGSSTSSTLVDINEAKGYSGKGKGLKRKMGKLRIAMTKYKKVIDYLNTVRRNLGNDQDYVKSLEIFTKYQEHKDTKYLDREVSELFIKKNPELYIEFTGFLGEDEVKENENEPKKKQKQVFTVRQLSSHEKKLFQYEDQMFKADVCFRRLRSTLVAANFLLAISNDDPNRKIDIKEFYKPLHLKCIKSMYKGGLEEGDDVHVYDEYMMELLREKPVKATKVLLRRLKSKFEEAIECRSIARAEIKEGFRALHEESRNHKTSVKKGTSTKSSSSEAEVKEEENRKEDETMMNTAIESLGPESISTENQEQITSHAKEIGEHVEGISEVSTWCNENFMAFHEEERNVDTCAEKEGGTSAKSTCFEVKEIQEDEVHYNSTTLETDTGTEIHRE